MRFLDKIPLSEKQNAWHSLIGETDAGVNQSEGYELSYVRDCMNSNMVKVLLMNHFGGSVWYSK